MVFCCQIIIINTTLLVAFAIPRLHESDNNITFSLWRLCKIHTLSPFCNVNTAVCILMLAKLQQVTNQSLISNLKAHRTKSQMSIVL